MEKEKTYMIPKPELKRRILIEKYSNLVSTKEMFMYTIMGLEVKKYIKHNDDQYIYSDHLDFDMLFRNIVFYCRRDGRCILYYNT